MSPYLWSRGLKRLDVVALTHGDHDHLDGLHAVLENFHVGEMWVGRDEDRPAFRDLLEEARSRGVTIVHRMQGDDSDWDGAHIDVLCRPTRVRPRSWQTTIRSSCDFRTATSTFF